MKNLIKDTLKNPQGKWSRKSLTMFASFAFSILLGTYIVVSDKILDEEVNRYAIEVFDSFMILVGALSGVTVLDKMVPNRETKNKDPEV